MPDVPLFLLSPDGNRDRATRLIRTATDLPLLPAYNLALTLDGVCAAVLRTAGVSTDDARAILAELWHPRRLHERPPAPRPDPRSATAARDRDFLRDLGQRIRLIRCARRLSLTEVWGRTGLEIHLLRDIEAGAFSPSAVALRRLAETFAVPVVTLVDQTTSEAELLHALAARSA